MLIRLENALTFGESVTVRKILSGKDVTSRGAFACGEKVSVEAYVPREFGARGVVLRMCAVNNCGQCGEERDYMLENMFDGTFRIEMPPLETGLYHWTLLFLRGADTLFAVSRNNVDIILSQERGKDFRFLVYSDSFSTPEWFRGGIMYHIFVDRFAIGGSMGCIPRPGVMEKDWYAPVRQYAQYPGAPVKNDLFYGGNLYGVVEKLPYLASLGVSVIYLSPVFSSVSNHKYDTGNYLETDVGFGSDEALDKLFEESRKMGIRVILDGVFNHTGDDSVYFDRYGRYKNGAWGHPDSPYRNWYCFNDDGSYDCWWGIEILPRLNHENSDCRSFFTSAEGVGANYIGRGSAGWRLDVADELSDSFLNEFRQAVKGRDPDSIIIGEVWENAAEKVAYGRLRPYFHGGQLDSVMNYPFRNAVCNFILKKDGQALADTLTEIYSEYPRCVCDCLMNILSTHDTERILTVLSGDSGACDKMTNAELSEHIMDDKTYAKGCRALKLASVIQYAVYGVPSLFYGDEAGLYGGRDPFCRKAYPWGREDKQLLSHYRRLGEIRKSSEFASAFSTGEFSVLNSGEGFIVFERRSGTGQRIICAANSGESEIPVGFSGTDIVTGEAVHGAIAPHRAVLISI